MVDRRFEKQLDQSRTGSGEIDVKALGELVTAAYREAADDRKRTDRSIALMITELEKLNNGLEKEVEKRTTELRASREELAAQNARFSAALTHLPQGVVMYDSEARLVICNARWRHMYEIPDKLAQQGTALLELMNYRAAQGTLGEEPAFYTQSVIESVRHGRQTNRVRELRDGRSISVTFAPIGDGGWVAIHEDITMRRRADQKIAHMAHHDALTGLPNRTLLLKKLAEGLAEVCDDRATAILYLDLDRFKTINDTLGHPVGDMLLKTVSGRLRRCVKARDTVGRIGGDEFAIIQTGISSRTDAAILARRICQTINAPYDLNGHIIVADVSVGIAVAPLDGREPNDLMKNADLALHRAKSDGKGTYRFFEPEMDARMKERRELEVELRHACENRLFELHYQPIIHLSSGTISGCEALLRWRHPTRGMVSPAEFIPVAEEIGLIGQLGEWVLRRACADAATWPEQVRVSVNVSPTQLAGGNLVPLVVDVLQTSELPADRLEIEITEDMLIRNPDVAQHALQMLRDVGVRIALDDFGTGYSSLSYLCRFPFDKIKIDRAFISDLPNREPAAIVSAITGLARSLDMTTTAEGVETAEQLRQVSALGCNEIQGFLASRPKSAADIARLVAPMANRQRGAA